MVVQIRVQMRTAILVRCQQPALAPESCMEEIDCPLCRGQPRGVAEYARGARERGNHERVPGSQDLVVAPGTDAPLARGKQVAPRLLEACLGGLGGNIQLARDVGERHDDAQVPRFVLEIGRPVESPVRPRDGPFLGSQQRLDLRGHPDVELSFLVLAIGVEARTKRALGREHLAQRPGNDPARGARERRVRGHRHASV